MMPTDLDRPAELTLWPGYAPARVAVSHSFPTLRAALAAAIAAQGRAEMLGAARAAAAEAEGRERFRRFRKGN